MLDELCCCTVGFVILILILFWVFGRVIVFQPRGTRPQQAYYPPPQQPEYQPQANDVMMTKCQYCGRMYDERLDGCPGCGL
jgi:hypothetical protein